MFSNIISKGASLLLGQGLKGFMGSSGMGSSGGGQIKIPSFGTRDMPLSVKTPAGAVKGPEQVSSSWNSVYATWLNILDTYDKLPKGTTSSQKLSTVLKRFR